MGYLMTLNDITKYRQAARLLWPICPYSNTARKIAADLSHAADTLERLNRHNSIVFW